MKKIFLILMAFVSVNVVAQDVIVKKDGNTILSKVLEVGTTNVKLKKHSNPNGPTYTLSISDIMVINYENGEKDDFSNLAKTNARQDVGSSTQYVQKAADGRNAELLSLYNRFYEPTAALKKKKKDTPHYLLIFGVKSSSIMSNEDIEMTLVRDVTTITDYAYRHIVYNINVKNKTNKTIYVDKGNCFKIFSDGSSLCYYENAEQVTVSSGGGSGASLGLGSVAGALGIGGVAGQIAGGVSVGGGTSHSVSTTYSQQRIIAIPPHASKNIVEEKLVKAKERKSMFGTSVYQAVECAECFDYEELKLTELEVTKNTGSKAIFGKRKYSPLILKKGLVKTGEVVEYNEDNTPLSQSYIVTYSTDERFQTYSSLQTNVYLREIIGVNKLKKKDVINGIIKLQNEKYIDDINQYTLEGYYLAD